MIIALSKGLMTVLENRRALWHPFGISLAVLASFGLMTVSFGAAHAATLTLYNGQHEQTVDTLVAGFEKANPGIKLVVHSDDGPVVANQIIQEGGKSPADVTELTATLMQAPIGTQTLATQIWADTSTLAFATAAPYTALMMIISFLATWLLARRFGQTRIRLGASRLA